MGASLLIPSLLVKCTLSSLAKSPTSVVNYPWKALRGVDDKILTFTFTLAALHVVFIIYSSHDSKLKDSHFNSCILIYLELNETKTELSQALPFLSLFGGFTYRPVAGPRTYYKKLTLEYYLQIWFYNSTCRPTLFCKSKEHFLHAIYTKN